MSIQPSETESSEDYSGPNLVLGLAVAAVMAFAWWGLMDALNVPYSRTTEGVSFSQQIVDLFRNTFPDGFWMGALFLQQRIRMPLGTRLKSAVKGALLGGALYVSLGIARLVLESTFGEIYGALIYFGLSAGALAFVIASAWTIVREKQLQAMSFRGYLAAMPRVSRIGWLAMVVWTLTGVSLGLTFALVFNARSNWAIFLPVSVALAIVGVWLSKSTIVFDASRRNNAIRTIISVVAIVGPILLMTFNLQFGLMVAVSVILLYAVITLRK